MTIYKTQDNIEKIITPDELSPYSIDVDFLEKLSNFIPIGTCFSIIPKNPGTTIADLNIIINPMGYFVCDGTAPNDPGAPVYNGLNKHMPNLTNNIFLCGFTSSGATGGSNNLANHRHSTSLTTPQITYAVGAISTNHTHSIQHTITTGDTQHDHTHSFELGSDQYGGSGRCHFQNEYPPLSCNYSAALASHSHTHTWSAGINYAPSISFNHVHTVSQDLAVPGQYIGIGSIPTLTDSRPNFISCYYVIKIKNI